MRHSLQKPEFNMEACRKHNEYLDALYVRLEKEGKFISGDDITTSEKGFVEEVIDEKKEEVVEKEVK